MDNRRWLNVIDFFDSGGSNPGPLLNSNQFVIPASTGQPKQVVASLIDHVKQIVVLDTTGMFIGLYSGAAGSEVLEAVVGLDQNQDIDLTLNKGARISLRSMTETPVQVENGFLCVQFLG